MKKTSSKSLICIIQSPHCLRDGQDEQWRPKTHWSVKGGKWCRFLLVLFSKCSAYKNMYKEKHTQINRLLCLSCLMFVMFVLLSNWRLTKRATEISPLKLPTKKAGWQDCWQLFNPNDLQVTTHKPHINCSWKREDYQRSQRPSIPSTSQDEKNSWY